MVVVAEAAEVAGLVSRAGGFGVWPGTLRAVVPLVSRCCCSQDRLILLLSARCSSHRHITSPPPSIARPLVPAVVHSPATARPAHRPPIAHCPLPTAHRPPTPLSRPSCRCRLAHPLCPGSRSLPTCRRRRRRRQALKRPLRCCEALQRCQSSCYRLRAVQSSCPNIDPISSTRLPNPPLSSADTSCPSPPRQLIPVPAHPA
jgi:hypothetical protein